MNKLVKRLTLGLTLVVAMGLLAGCGSEEKMGYVDKAKILSQSTKAQEVQTKLQTKSKEIKDRLAASHANQSPEEYAKAEQSAQEEMAIYQGAVLREFQNYMESNLAVVAKDKKLGIIVDKAAITSGGIDVTEDLLKRLEADSNGQASTEKKEGTK